MLLLAKFIIYFYCFFGMGVIIHFKFKNNIEIRQFKENLHNNFEISVLMYGSIYFQSVIFFKIDTKK